VRTERYESWTRERKNTRYFRSIWRPDLSLLVLVGLALDVL
jgi:hypothetical protein